MTDDEKMKRIRAGGIRLVGRKGEVRVTCPATGWMTAISLVLEDGTHLMLEDGTSALENISSRELMEAVGMPCLPYWTEVDGNPSPASTLIPHSQHEANHGQKHQANPERRRVVD